MSRNFRLSISTRKSDDKLNEYNNLGIDESLIKLNPKEITESLNIVENIRSGLFNYKDLEEVHFINDVNLSNLVNDKKKIEENNSNNKNIYVLESSIDKVCIIRFPLNICNEIKKLLLNRKLQLEIYPTNLFNSRLFIIDIKSLNKQYYGILVELGTYLEIHKTLDGINLYKTGDISQMLYVFDNKNNKQNKKNKKIFKKIIKNNYQLNCGISKKTENFHFENYTKLFKYHDIYFAENIIYEYLNNVNYYDYYDIYIKTYKEMMNHIQMENNNNQNQIVDESTNLSQILKSLDNSFNLMNFIQKENGNINFETLLNYDIDEMNYESDVSDLLLGGNYYLKKKVKN